MAISAAFALAFGRLISHAPSRRAMVLTARASLRFTVTAFGFFHFYSGPAQSTLGHMACGYLTIGVISAAANAAVNWRHSANLWLLFSLLYIPTVLGLADSATATDPARALSEIETDRGVVVGRIVRVTSAYVLIAKGKCRDHDAHEQGARDQVVLRPIPPAADFLDGPPATAPSDPVTRGEMGS